MPAFDTRAALSLDVLSRVFELLNLRDLTTACLVCSHWNARAQSQALWKV
jgi:hypothetical protein